MTNSRSKGKRGELEACGAVAQHWGVMLRRSAQHCGADAEGNPDLLGADTMWPEVKRYSRIAAMDFLRQAESDTDGRTPFVLMRENHDTDWTVMVRVSDAPEFSRWLVREMG